MSAKLWNPDIIGYDETNMRTAPNHPAIREYYTDGRPSKLQNCSVPVISGFFSGHEAEIICWWQDFKEQGSRTGTILWDDYYNRAMVWHLPLDHNLYVVRICDQGNNVLLHASEIAKRLTAHQECLLYQVAENHLIN